MDQIPHRLVIARPYRFVLDFAEKYLILPNINPSIYQLITIVLSITFIFIENVYIRILLLIIILVLDWLDGATARKYLTTSKKGYMIDVVVDRISEGVIFIGEIIHPIGLVFFLLWLTNIFLSFVSIKTNQHYSMALRAFYILFLMHTLWL